MKCPNCSFFNEVRAEVCKICGTKLEKKIDKVTNTVSLDEALREKYLPASIDEGTEEQDAKTDSEGIPAWEPIPGLLVASRPRAHKNEDRAFEVEQTTDSHSEAESDAQLEAEETENAGIGTEVEVLPENTDVESGEEMKEESVAEEHGEDTEEEPGAEEIEAEEEEEEKEIEEEEEIEEIEEEDEEKTDKLAYIPPVYESLTGFERVDDDLPIAVPPVVEYDEKSKEPSTQEHDEYEDTITKNSRDRWIIAIIVFLCILLVVLGAIIIRILWQWWNDDQPLTTTPRNSRTTPVATSSTSSTLATTNPERANPVIGKFTYDLQSYLVSDKTDFFAYMLNPMEAKLKLGDLHSLGVTKTEVEDVKYSDGVLYLDTWVYNAVEDKVFKRLVKWEFNCTLGEFIDVTDFKHDFVLAEDEQKRQETDETIETTTETTSSATSNSEASSTQPVSSTPAVTTQSTATTTTAAAETTTFDDSYFVKSGSVGGGSATESDSLSKMRMGDHGYFHRVVFDFLGEKAPVYTASIDDGGYTLNLYLTNMMGHSGQPSIASWSNMTSIEVFSDSPGSLQVQMRFSEPIMINTFTIDNPGRIVIDVRSDSNWDTPQ